MSKDSIMDEHSIVVVKRNGHRSPCASVTIGGMVKEDVNGR